MRGATHAWRLVGASGWLAAVLVACGGASPAPAPEGGAARLAAADPGERGGGGEGSVKPPPPRAAVPGTATEELVGVEVLPAAPPSPEDLAAAAARPTAEELAALSRAPTVYVDWHTAQVLEGLEIYVSALEVKRTMEGDEALRTSLRLRAGDQVSEFNCDDARVTSFAGYHVQVRGGSKESVGVAVIRAAPRK